MQDTSQTYVEIIMKYCQCKIGIDNFAACIMLVSSIAWPLAFIYANQHNFSFAITLIVRGLSIFIFSFMACVYYGYSFSCKDSVCFSNLMARTILFCIHGAATAFSQFYLPLPMVHTICTVGPAFGVILDFFLNGTKITRKQIYGIIVTLIGVNLVVNGDIILSKINPDYHITSQFQNYRTKSTYVMLLVSLLLLICMVGWAYAVLLTKKVGMNSTQMNFYSGISMTITGALFAPNTILQPQDLSTYLWSYVFMGMLFIIVNIAFNLAVLYCENIGKILTVCNSVVLISYLISILRYKESINPIAGLGSITLIIGISTVLLSKK